MGIFRKLTKQLFGHNIKQKDINEQIIDGIVICGDSEHPPTEHPPTEHPPTEHPPTEHPPTEHPPTEHPPTEHPPTEHPPTEHPPTEHPPQITHPRSPTPDHRPTEHPPTEEQKEFTVPDAYMVFLGATGKAERTKKEYRWDLLWWNKIKSLSTITWQEIEKSINGLHAATARRKIAVIRSFAKWQLREGNGRLHLEVGMILPPKIPGRMPKDRGDRGFKELSKQAIELCKNSDKRGIWIGLMLCCGLRISEIQVVELSHSNTIKVIGKGNKERQLPVPTWLYDTILNYKSDDWRCNRQIIWLQLKKMNIKRPHSLRHTYASQLMRNDFKLEEVKGLLGHAKLDTTLIYAKIKLPDDVAKRLGVE